ncbi:carotenoid biosynthesis protein [Lolliginicoccus suaedae]|uniref:carotenoid biosynthesis protein n=1 Tax=Lolliginicoccus suaedae TaxID=2605429 RepID=UPI001F3AAE59|nr:carotenoid biosynthesis protein [Lolliginicoccus suaedae]
MTSPLLAGRWLAGLAVLLSVAAVLAQIVFPLAEGSAADAVTALVVVLLAGAALVHALASRGAVFALALLVGAAGGGLAAEAVGVATGFPFGCYDYALDRLGPAVADVPVIVPLAWVGGSYPVWCAASAVVSVLPRHRRWIRVPLAAATIVAWDLYLDPQMVTAGYWTWCAEGPALPGFPIPLSNYAGWALVALCITLLLAVTDRAPSPTPRTRMRRDAAPLALFAWTWLGSALAHLVFLPDLRLSAAYGFVGMAITGVPLLLAARRIRPWRSRMHGKPADPRARRSSDLAR